MKLVFKEAKELVKHIVEESYKFIFGQELSKIGHFGVKMLKK